MNAQYLQNIIDEAKLIVSRHDGVHDAHGTLAGISGWYWFVDKGLESRIDWENVEELIVRLRVLDKTGVYPRQVYRPKPPISASH